MPTQPIEQVEVSAYDIPTDAPESDGTHTWRSTTLVVSEVLGGGSRGFGYTYAAKAAARLLQDQLGPAIFGMNALDTLRCRDAMWRSVRNAGRPGVAATAMAALDIALWDLKAKLLGVSLLSLLGSVREAIPVYGSGGFTSYDRELLCRQLGAWVDAGIPRVKMKVGHDARQDLERVQAVRDRIGSEAALFVDANGAYRIKQALRLAQDFAELGVVWFEEPVSSDDLEGLRFIREHSPAGMNIAAGEYGYDWADFQRMLSAGSVDVLQIDATRTGITGFMEAAILARAQNVPVSAHTAPALHAHLGCAVPELLHVEYFHDHVRIEDALMLHTPVLMEGSLHPDRSRKGLGLSLDTEKASPHKVEF